jgi:hypothetical protein
LLLACASSPAPVVPEMPPVVPETPPVAAATPEDLPPLSDIRECLFSSRRPLSKGLTSRMVRPGSYNECMRAKGWRSSDAKGPERASKS